MFRKLLSNLPFNPSLIQEVSFYAQRVHSEQGIRRSGMVLIVMAMMLQMFAVIAPPQPSLAANANDIISGGFTKKTTAIEHCARNTQNFRNVIQYFHIDCHNLEAAEARTIRSTDHNRHLMSLGRLPYGKDGERRFSDVAGGPYYMRYLWSWDSYGSSSYQALVGTNTKGQMFMILYDCGNVVMLDSDLPTTATPTAPTPVAAPKKPKPEITQKTTLPGTPQAGQKVTPGTVLGYRIFFRNAGDAAATNVFVEDSTPRHTSFLNGSQGSGGANRYAYTDSPYPGHGHEPHVYWAYNNFPAGASGYYVDFKVTVNTGVTEGQEICNTAFIRSNETSQTASERICHYVTVPRANNPTPTVQITPVVPLPPPTVVPPAQKPCIKSTDVNDVLSCQELHKTAINNTKGGVDANNTTAAAGETITYTLTTKNNATVPMQNYIVQDNLADTMLYAEKLTDLGGGTFNNDTKIITWAPVTIQPGETITKKITIKILDKIPDTPTPPSNPGAFDLMMTNYYGDTTNIKLPGSVAVVVARANTTLPNTGPGTTLTIAILIAMTAGYFFARSRLMTKELAIVREDYAAAGGI